MHSHVVTDAIKWCLLSAYCNGLLLADWSVHQKLNPVSSVHLYHFECALTVRC